MYYRQRGEVPPLEMNLPGTFWGLTQLYRTERPEIMPWSWPRYYYTPWNKKTHAGQTVLVLEVPPPTRVIHSPYINSVFGRDTAKTETHLRTRFSDTHGWPYTTFSWTHAYATIHTVDKNCPRVGSPWLAPTIIHAFILPAHVTRIALQGKCRPRTFTMYVSHAFPIHLLRSIIHD